MGMDLAKSPLKLFSVQTARTNDLCCKLEMEELVGQINGHMHHDSTVICWMMNRIIWGTWKNGAFELVDGSKLELSYLLEMRVFNNQEELLLKKQNAQLTGRYVSDEGTKSEEVVDTISRLWGTNKGSHIEKGIAMLKDDERKLCLQIPMEEAAEYYGLITRNYIDSDARTGQSGYVDYRYLEIATAEEG